MRNRYDPSAAPYAHILCRVIGHNYMRERLSDGRWLSTCLRCGKQTKRRFRTSRI